MCSVSNCYGDTEEEKAGELADVLDKLTSGKSHWYTINGVASMDLLLCRQLGFFSWMNLYAFLFTKGLPAYRLNKRIGQV